MLTVVETADQVTQHGGDDGGFETAGDKAYGLAWDRHPTGMVGNGLEHGVHVGNVIDASEVCEGRGKREMCARPGEQTKNFEPVEGSPQMLPPTPPMSPCSS